VLRLAADHGDKKILSTILGRGIAGARYHHFQATNQAWRDLADGELAQRQRAVSVDPALSAVLPLQSIAVNALGVRCSAAPEKAVAHVCENIGNARVVIPPQAQFALGSASMPG